MGADPAGWDHDQTKARVSPVGLDAVEPKRCRVHAAVHGGLMQLDERIRVEPMPTGLRSPIDHHDIRVRMLDQRVDEPHPQRPRTDNQMVSLQERARAVMRVVARS